MTVVAGPGTVTITEAEYERLQAAEETCWSMMIWIGLGFMEGVEIPIRENITSGGMTRWAHLCVEQGLMRAEDPDDEKENVDG